MGRFSYAKCGEKSPSAVRNVVAAGVLAVSIAEARVSSLGWELGGWNRG